MRLGGVINDRCLTTAGAAARTIPGAQVNEGVVKVSNIQQSPITAEWTAVDRVDGLSEIRSGVRSGPNTQANASPFEIAGEVERCSRSSVQTSVRQIRLYLRTHTGKADK